MYTFEALLNNLCLLSVGAAWITAQIIKVFTGYFQDKKFSLSQFFSGTGGMPSSHSATVLALLTSAAIKYGFESFEVAISMLFAIIVMSDATGVRYETGKQAKALNRIVKELFSDKRENAEGHFKELIGHTPLQVLMGALLGVGVAFIMYAIVGV